MSELYICISHCFLLFLNSPNVQNTIKTQQKHICCQTFLLPKRWFLCYLRKFDRSEISKKRGCHAIQNWHVVPNIRRKLSAGHSWAEGGKVWGRGVLAPIWSLAGSAGRLTHGRLVSMSTKTMVTSAAKSM